MHISEGCGPWHSQITQNLEDKLQFTIMNVILSHPIFFICNQDIKAFLRLSRECLAQKAGAWPDSVISML